MILKKLHWYHSFKTEKIEAFTVSYHSLIPKWYSFSDIKKMNNSFNNRLDQGGFDGVYEGKLLGGRLVAVKVLTKLLMEKNLLMKLQALVELPNKHS
jgi:hypothetical protein